MILTLSQVQAQTWEHLDEAAGHSVQLAQVYDDTWAQARANVANSTWQGAGQEAAHAAHVADASAAMPPAEALRGIAKAARTGAETLRSMRSELLAAVAQTTQAGYQVSEGYTVTPPPNMPPWLLAVKAPEIAARTAQLQGQAAALSAYDMDVTGQVTTPQSAIISATSHFATPKASPASYVGPWCNRQEMPGRCTDQGTTVWPRGTFNPNITIDTSHASTSGPSLQPTWPVVGGGVPHDWPSASRSTPTGGRAGVRMMDFTTDGPPPIAPWDTPDNHPPLTDIKLNNVLLPQVIAQTPDAQLPNVTQQIINSLPPSDSRYEDLRSQLTQLQHQPCTWGEFRDKLAGVIAGTAGTTLAAGTAETGIGAAAAVAGALGTLAAADGLNQCLDRGLP